MQQINTNRRKPRKGQSMTYGNCPKCGAMGAGRERRPNGNDECENGHIYPSANAVMGPTTYELNRRYEFTATADSVFPVVEGAIVCVWYSDGAYGHNADANHFDWFDEISARHGPITHFMVTEYPAEKHKGWLNICSNQEPKLFPSRESADEMRMHNCIACIRIEWTEGEGL